MNKNAQRIQHEKNYIAFLETRLRSKHYKENASAAEYAATEAKLKKARLVFKLLK
jgi:hypothetical protein